MAILEELPEDSNATQETLIVDKSSGEPQLFAFESDGRRVELVEGESEVELHDSDSDEMVEDPANAQELYEQIQEERMSESLESKLDLVIWCMPFVFLFEIMSILIQQQYGIEITWRNEGKSLASRLPLLVLFIWWSQTEKRRWLSQSAVFLLGTLCGSWFLYVLHEAPYGQAVTQTPALGTLWIYSVVKMDLPWACLSLALTAAYIKYIGLELML